MNALMTESQLVSACLQYLNLRGIFAWRNNSTGIWDEKQGRYRRSKGMLGTADILGVFPGGRALAVECKSARGKTTLDQEVFLGLFRQAGGLAMVVRSIGELMEALEP